MQDGLRVYRNTWSDGTNSTDVPKNWPKQQSYGLFATAKLLVFFTALHVMQTRSSDENSVCPSVRLSVCQNCDKTENCPDLYTIRMNIYPSFLRRRMVGGGRPLLPEILGQPTPIGAKSPIFNQ